MKERIELYTNLTYKDKLSFKSQCNKEDTNMSAYLCEPINNIVNYIKEYNKLPEVVIKHPREWDGTFRR